MQLGKREYAGIAAAGGVLATLAVGAWFKNGTTRPPTSPSSEKPLDFEIPATGPDTSTPVPAPSDTTASTATPAPDAPPAKIKAFVSGAVKRPGVYSFTPGARIDDAIRSAGGFKPNADMGALNLADFLRDADQINVPPKSAVQASVAPPRPTIVRGNTSPVIVYTRPVRRSAPKLRKEPVEAQPLPESAPPAKLPDSPSVVAVASAPGVPVSAPTLGRVLGKVPLPTTPEPAEEGEAVLATESDALEPSRPARSPRSRSAASAVSTKFKVPGDGIINLNTATAAELEKLPGVGPSTSAAILEHRQRIGRFRDASQLMDLKGTFRPHTQRQHIAAVVQGEAITVSLEA